MGHKESDTTEQVSMNMRKCVQGDKWYQKHFANLANLETASGLSKIYFGSSYWKYTGKKKFTV